MQSGYTTKDDMLLTEQEILNIAANIGIKMDTWGSPIFDNKSQMINLVTIAIKINDERKTQNASN
jgi:hypothetical protein